MDWTPERLEQWAAFREEDRRRGERASALHVEQGAAIARLAAKLMAERDEAERQRDIRNTAFEYERARAERAEAALEASRAEVSEIKEQLDDMAEEWERERKLFRQATEASRAESARLRSEIEQLRGGGRDA